MKPPQAGAPGAPDLDEVRRATELLQRIVADRGVLAHVPLEMRQDNTWRLALADVPTAEMLEVQLVNPVAPFILCARLKPLMLRVPSRDKHSVNVSAMEGISPRGPKTDKHPHTNMAKAALNMMTLTARSAGGSGCLNRESRRARCMALLGSKGRALLARGGKER